MAIKSALTKQDMSDDNPLALTASGEAFTNPLMPSALPVLERQEQYVAEHMQAVTEKVDSGNLDANDLEMAARAFIDGMWLNKSEEVGSYISAVAVKIIYPELFEGRSISSIREDMLTKLEAESAEFAEKRPITATTANIAGSLLSPASVAGGQVISQAARIRQGAQAAKASDEVAATLGGAFAPRADEAAKLAQQYGRQQATGRILQAPTKGPLKRLGLKEGIPVAGSGRIAEIVSKTPTPVAAATLAGAEGAVIGYEGENTEEKLKNAAFTAGISAAVPFIFAGAKKTYDFATENKMAQQIGKGGDFVNLMFTEHGLAPVYKSVVSKAYGGRTLTEQQARKMAGRALTPAMARKAGEDFTNDAATKTKKAKAAITTASKENIAEIRLKLDEQIEEAKLLSSKASGKAKEEYDQQLSLLQEAKENAEVAKALAVKEADASVNAANAAFRGSALRQSAPPGTPNEMINDLGMMDPQDANAALDDMWRKYGFKTAQGKKYTLNPEDASSFIDKIAQNHPELALIGTESGSLLRSIKIYVAEEIATKAPEGVMKGEDLLQLRSNIGRAINSLSNESISTRRFSAEVQDYFHDILEKGLTKKEAAEFAADRKAWSIRSTVDDAVTKASGGNAKAGAFTATEYLDAVRSYSPRFAARGKGRLQAEAQKLAKINEENKANILGLAEDQLKQVATQGIKERALLKRQLDSAKQKLKSELSAEIKELRRRSQVTKTSEEAREALRLNIVEAQERYARQLQDIDTKIARAKNESATLKDMMPSTFDPSVFESLFNTSLLGQAALFVTPKVSESIGASIGSSIAAGLPTANVLAREATQRLLARQTGGQAKIREAMSATGEVLASKGITPSQTTGAQAGAVGAAIAPKELMFSEERKEMIQRLPESGKKRLYQNLKANGRLERLQAEDPKLFKELKRAAGE